MTTWTEADTKGAEWRFHDKGWAGVMDYTAELLAARGGTMTAEELAVLEIARGWVARTTEPAPMHPNNVGALLSIIDAHVAEVATMRERLSACEAELDEYRQKMLSEGGKFLKEQQRADLLQEERDEWARRALDRDLEAARLEVEAQHLRADWTTTWRERAEAAEAKLAALKEDRRHTTADALREKVRSLQAEIARIAANRAELAQSTASAVEERDAARAELARLKPSGQVAEDVAWVSASVENRLIQFWMGHPEYDRSADEPRRRAAAALSRLAALAQQGQEAKSVNGDGAPWRSSAGTCGHDDAKEPGHVERVTKRSQAFNEAACDHRAGWYVQVGTNLMECSACRLPVPTNVAFAAAREIVTGTRSSFTSAEAAAMHPNGRCECGLCEWCQRSSDAAHFNDGAEAMRAACLEAVLAVYAQYAGCVGAKDLSDAIDGIAL